MPALNSGGCLVDLKMISGKDSTVVLTFSAVLLDWKCSPGLFIRTCANVSVLSFFA